MSERVKHSWLWRAWMSLRYSGVCWKHMEEMACSYDGLYCLSCEAERADNHKRLRDAVYAKYGIRSKP